MVGTQKQAPIVTVTAMATFEKAWAHFPSIKIITSSGGFDGTTVYEQNTFLPKSYALAKAIEMTLRELGLPKSGT
jgi:hypothetical protein